MQLFEESKANMPQLFMKIAYKGLITTTIFKSSKSRQRPVDQGMDVWSIICEYRWHVSMDNWYRCDTYRGPQPSRYSPGVGRGGPQAASIWWYHEEDGSIVRNRWAVNCHTNWRSIQSHIWDELEPGAWGTKHAKRRCSCCYYVS